MDKTRNIVQIIKDLVDYQNTDGPRMKTDPLGNNSLLRVYVRICSTNYKIVKV